MWRELSKGKLKPRKKSWPLNLPSKRWKKNRFRQINP